MKYTEIYQDLVLAFKRNKTLPRKLVCNGYRQLMEFRHSTPVPESWRVDTHVHHVKPLSEGGPDIDENKVCLAYHEHVMAHAFLFAMYKDAEMLDAIRILTGGLSPKNLFDLDLVYLNDTRNRHSEEEIDLGSIRPFHSNPYKTNDKPIQSTGFDSMSVIQFQPNIPKCVLNQSTRISPLNPGNKILFSFSLDGTFIKRWDSIVELKNELNISDRDISRIIDCAKLRTSSAMWNIWRFGSDVNISEDGIVTFRTPPRERKIVYQYDFTGKLMMVWPSVSVAADKTNCDYTTIRRCCDKRERSCGGFMWAYREDVIKNGIPRYSRRWKDPRSILVQIDPETNQVVRTWHSLSEVEHVLHIRGGHISQCCYGSKKTVHGFVWKYLLPEQI